MLQSVWQHPGGGGEGCGEREEPAAAAPAAAQLYLRRVLPAVHQRGTGETKGSGRQSERYRLLLSESKSEHQRLLLSFPIKRSGGIQKCKAKTAIYLIHHICFPI